MRQPIKLKEHGGDYYKLHSLAPLMDKKLEKHEEEKAYKQKQAAVQEVIYWMANKSTFLQVKNEITATAIWKKVTLIHADKGLMYEINFLMQLQMIQYVENRDMWEHLTKMAEIWKWLAERIPQSPMSPSCPISIHHSHLSASSVT